MTSNPLSQEDRFQLCEQKWVCLQWVPLFIRKFEHNGATWMETYYISPFAGRSASTKEKWFR